MSRPDFYSTKLKPMFLMKKIVLFVLLGALISIDPLQAQQEGRSAQDPSAGFGMSALDSMSVLSIPFGYTNIGGQQFVGLRIQPEINIWKIGIGLDIPLMFNLDSLQAGKASMRTDEFRDGVGVLRLIRYLRYGFKKRDRYYVKVGDLTGEYIGYGSLVNNYTNSPSFEKRKVGASFDIMPLPYVGLEGMYSDFSTFGLLALRPYTRPFYQSENNIVKSIEFGLTYTIDGDRSDSTTVFTKQGRTSGFGIDAGVNIINTSFLQLTGYMQYSRLQKVRSDSLNSALEALALERPFDADLIRGYNGAGGFSIGTQLRLNLIANVLNLDVRLERLWYGNYYRPQFFNAIYEINKDAAILSLAQTYSVTGTYATLGGTLLNKVRLRGGILLPDEYSSRNPAFVHVNADANVGKLVLSGNYVKGELADLGEAFTLDERSLLNVRAAYRIYNIFMVGVDYRWTFARVEEEGAPTRFKPVSFVMPYFGLYIPLNF